MKELYLEPKKVNKNALTGRFIKGSIPHNKGKKWSDYLPVETQKKILSGLRRNGNSKIGGLNAIPVVGIKNGKTRFFKSGKQAGETLGIHQRNINSCCHKKRKTAGGYEWYFFKDNDWIEEIKI